MPLETASLPNEKTPKGSAALGQTTSAEDPLADAGRNQQRMTLTALIGATVIAAVLHLGQDIFLPLAFAVLITFALSPIVSFLRNRGLPIIVSVLGTVTIAFAAIGLFLLVVVSQLGQLAQQLPTFQANIVTKIEALQNSGSENGMAARLSDIFTSINSEIGRAIPGSDLPQAPGAEGEGEAEGAAAPRAAAPEPMPVRVVENESPFETLTALVLPLISPIGTAGLVIVVVIFMLLERDELRDRFIRLVGSSDIHRTTQVLEEAGGRVTHYLLAQLLVNTIYAVPIGIGLWLIGVPNAMLWCLMTLVLRFVPYIGSILSAAFPLFLAFAVSPDWSAVIWTATLFGVVELITSNVIEPWLYGSRTGVSSLAIIVAAIFWTWVWGPMGLVLSTPLTVCLVVLGRHIPQFELFDVLFGDRPVLAPEARLYQRLLVGDVVESAFRAEEALEEAWIADYHRDVGVPALMMAQMDYERGVINQTQEERVATTAMRFLDELDEVVAEELADAREGNGDAEEPLQAEGLKIAVLGGRSALDDVTARMLGQAAAAEGAKVQLLSHEDLVPRRFAAVTGADAPVVILNFLDTAPARGALLQLRRIKRAAPQKRVGVVIWEASDPQKTSPIRRVDPAQREAVMALGADFCVTGLEEALEEAFADKPPVPLKDEAQSAAAKRAKKPRRLQPAASKAVEEGG